MRNTGLHVSICGSGCGCDNAVVFCAVNAMLFCERCVSLVSSQPVWPRRLACRGAASTSVFGPAITVNSCHDHLKVRECRSFFETVQFVGQCWLIWMSWMSCANDSNGVMEHWRTVQKYDYSTAKVYSEGYSEGLRLFIGSLSTVNAKPSNAHLSPPSCHDED
jgi:hypothetical protein